MTKAAASQFESRFRPGVDVPSFVDFLITIVYMTTNTWIGAEKSVE